MKNQTINALEWQLDGKNLLTDFLMQRYKEIPISNLEKRIRYQITLKKHFVGIAELCNSIEDSLKMKLQMENDVSNLG